MGPVNLSGYEKTQSGATTNMRDNYRMKQALISKQLQENWDYYTQEERDALIAEKNEPSFDMDFDRELYQKRLKEEDIARRAARELRQNEIRIMNGGDDNVGKLFSEIDNEIKQKFNTNFNMNTKKNENRDEFGQTPEQYMQLKQELIDQLNMDPIVAQALDPLTRKVHRSPVEEKFQTAFMDALFQIYRARVNKLLKNQKKQVNTMTPLLTKDGVSVLTQENTDPKDLEFVEAIDDYLMKNNKFEFYRFVMPGVLYTFGYLMIMDLERCYRLIGGKMRSMEDDLGKLNEEDFDPNKEFVSQVISKSMKEIGIEVETQNELRTLTEYLNELTRSAAFMYLTYKEKVHFPEDVAFENHIQMRDYYEEHEKQKNLIETGIFELMHEDPRIGD